MNFKINDKVEVKTEKFKRIGKIIEVFNSKITTSKLYSVLVYYPTGKDIRWYDETHLKLIEEK